MPDNITLISSPPDVALIDEGVEYCLQKYAASSGSEAWLSLTFPQTQSAYLDKYFEIALPAGNFKIYFKTAPDYDGYEIRTWDIADTYNQFMVKLIEDLSKFYELISLYTINYPTPPYVQFTAREIGFNVISFVGSDVTGLVYHSGDYGEPDGIPDDFKIYAAPVKHISGNQHFLLPLGEDLLSIDEDRKAYPNFIEYLKAQLSSSFHFPFNGEIVHEVENAVVKYFIRYAEYYDAEIKQLYNTYASPKYAVLGGLKRIDSDTLIDESSDYFSCNPMRFLTWAPQTKRTFAEAPERLYFLKTQSADIELRMQATWIVPLPIVTVETITSDAYTIVEIAAGVPELFAGEDISHLSEYSIWLETVSKPGVKLSEVRTFKIDQQNYRNKRTIFFKNSFGMYETLCCTGNLSISDNLESEEIEVLSGPVFRRKKNLSENNPLYTLNSGWLEGKETRLWLEDLLLSKDVFLCLGDFLLPVITKGGKISRQNDLSFLYSLELQFEPDFKEQRYSAIIGEGATFYVDEDMVIYTDESDIKLIK